MSALIDSLSSATNSLNISNPVPIVTETNDLSGVVLTNGEIQNFLDGYFDYDEELDDVNLTEEQKKEMEKKFIKSALEGYSQLDADELLGDDEDDEKKTDPKSNETVVRKLIQQIEELERTSLYNPVAMSRQMRTSLRLKKQLLSKYQKSKRRKLE